MDGQQLSSLLECYLTTGQPTSQQLPANVTLFLSNPHLIETSQLLAKNFTLPLDKISSLRLDLVLDNSLSFLVAIWNDHLLTMPKNQATNTEPCFENLACRVTRLKNFPEFQNICLVFDNSIHKLQMIYICNFTKSIVTTSHLNLF